MRNWKVPGIILILLILAMTFRWSTVSSQTLTREVLKFEKDNWNSSIYQQRFNVSGVFSEKLVRSPSDLMWFDSQSLTAVWGVLVAGSTLWLLIAVSKTKKKDISENNSLNT